MRRVRHEHRRDPHDRAIRCGTTAGFRPARTAADPVLKRRDRLANAEDPVCRQMPGETSRIESALEQVLERPEGQLRVVGWQAHDATALATIRQVVADL